MVNLVATLLASVLASVSALWFSVPGYASIQALMWVGVKVVLLLLVVELVVIE